MASNPWVSYAGSAGQPVSFAGSSGQPVSMPPYRPVQQNTGGKILGVNNFGDGGGGSGSSGGGNGGDGSNGGGSPPSPPGPDMNAINAIADPIFAYLDQAKQRIQDSLQPLIANIGQNFETAKQSLDTKKASGEAMLGEQGTQAQLAKQESENKIRRLYNELTRAGIQKFGGASSAGQGYGELLGVEAQRSNAQTAQEYNTAKREIEVARYQLDQDYQDKILQLQQDKANKEFEAQQNYQDRMSEIDRARAETQSNKAAMKYQALQEFRNQVFQIQWEDYQQKQLLSQQKEAVNRELAMYDQNLNAATNAGGQALGAYTSSDVMNPTSNAQLPGSPATDLNDLSQYSGVVNKKDDFDLFPSMEIGGSAQLR